MFKLWVRSLQSILSDFIDSWGEQLVDNLFNDISWLIILYCHLVSGRWEDIVLHQSGQQ